MNRSFYGGIVYKSVTINYAPNQICNGSPAVSGHLLLCQPASGIPAPDSTILLAELHDNLNTIGYNGGDAFIDSVASAANAPFGQDCESLEAEDITRAQEFTIRAARL